MKQSVRHAVKSHLGAAYKASREAEHAAAVSVVLNHGRMLMAGKPGMEPEYYVWRQAQCLKMVKAAQALCAVSGFEALEPLAKAEALLMASPEEAAVMVSEPVEALTGQEPEEVPVP